MTDVARDMGVAHGSLYNYVQSKEALFLLLVEQWGRIGADLSNRELPIKTPSIQNITKRLAQRIDEVFPLPALDAALLRRRSSDPLAELEGIVRELFHRTAESREGATILERSALDVPELYQLFFRQVRRELFERMTRYVKMRVDDGSFENTDPAIAARFIIESVTFFARHRHLDPEPTLYDDDVLRNCVVALLTRSLMPGRQRSRTGNSGRTRRTAGGERS